MTERYCPSCGTRATPGARFCAACGAPQPPPPEMADAPAAPVAPAAPAAPVAVTPGAVPSAGIAPERRRRSWWARLAPVSVVLGLAAGGIGIYRAVSADSGPTTPPTTETTSGALTGPRAHCTNQAAGYALDYPATWHTAPDRAGSECVLFDPEPFTSPTGAGTINEVTIQVLTVPLPAEDLARPASNLTEVAENTPTTVAGKPALRFLTVFKDGGGESDYEYLVEIAPDTTLVLQVQGLYAEDFEEAKAALDVMALSLVFI